MIRKTILAAALLALTTSAAFAQSTSSQNKPDDERGFVSFSEFGGTFDASGHVVKLDTSAGYNFNSHFGADFGVPFYFAGGTTTSATGKESFSANGMGAPYIAFRGMYKDESFHYASRFAIFLPKGDATSGLSSGQTSIDWTNHFENSFGRVTPFGDLGVANMVGDTARYNRAYTSYGNNFHLEGGTTVDVIENISVGGSAYDIFPWGTQTIYSRAVPKGSINLPPQAKGKGAFLQYSYFQGPSDLAKDDGASAWVEYSPVPYATAQVAFTRSFAFEMNSFSIGLRINIGYLAKARSRR